MADRLLCLDCNKLLSSNPRAKRCHACAGKIRQKLRLKCLDCGKQLNRNAERCDHKRCHQCAGKNRRKPFVFCLDCGKKLSHSARSLGFRHCSICANIARCGTHLSAEHRKRISLGNIGKHHSKETKIKISQAKIGHQVTAEARAKISAGNMGNHKALGCHHPHTEEELVKMRGLNHWCYRDGKGNESYDIGWKKLTLKIRERDDHLCQYPDCYLPENGKKHECHHIDRNKKNNVFTNLILLCRKHHGETKRGNAEFWQEFYETIQIMRGIS